MVKVYLRLISAYSRNLGKLHYDGLCRCGEGKELKGQRDKARRKSFKGVMNELRVKGLSCMLHAK